MKQPVGPRVLRLAILALTLVSAPAFAQAPQDVTYTGRLVDSRGNPLPGTVNLELRVFDADTGGRPLYSEHHLRVALDVTGGFSVRLGLGTLRSGTFDADLFSDVDRWLEVVVDSEVLTPRQIIGSVPWALVAERVNEVVRDPNAARFEDCGDGTVADHQTGLQWEKKTGTVGSRVDCPAPLCSDPHFVNNGYWWSLGGLEPDGHAFTDFLARLNSDPMVVGATGDEAWGDPAADPTVCFAHHCEWHLPAIGELRTILIGPDAAPGQASTCAAPPCIDPGFAAVGGPTVPHHYWSMSSHAESSGHVWYANFQDGNVSNKDKEKPTISYVRAVRAGTCD